MILDSGDLWQSIVRLTRGKSATVRILMNVVNSIAFDDCEVGGKL